MMAAVPCAARRLGGSLLQRTQAAVAEEGRQVVPSRLMRSRQFSTKHARMTPEEVKSRLEKEKGELREMLDTLERLRKETPPPDESHLRLLSICRAVDGVLTGAAKLAFFGILTVASFGGDSVEAQAVTNKNY